MRSRLWTALVFWLAPAQAEMNRRVATEKTTSKHGASESTPTAADSGRSKEERMNQGERKIAQWTNVAGHWYVTRRPDGGALIERRQPRRPGSDAQLDLDPQQAMVLSAILAGRSPVTSDHPSEEVPSSSTSPAEGG